MNFNIIDQQTWGRKQGYDHFLDYIPCTYSMTVNLEITKLLAMVKEYQLKFFTTILYGISSVVNCHSEFRMDLDEQGNLGFYSYSNPCYTVFHEKAESFTDVWTEYDSDFNIFIKNYNKDMMKYQNDPSNSKPLKNNNIFNVSCIPWTSFTGFNLNLQKGYNYFLPIFTIGKYHPEGNKTFLPFAMQVHHAVCDGFHVARFTNELQEWIDTFNP